MQETKTEQHEYKELNVASHNIMDDITTQIVRNNGQGMLNTSFNSRQGGGVGDDQEGCSLEQHHLVGGADVAEVAELGLQ